MRLIDLGLLNVCSMIDNFFVLVGCNFGKTEAFGVKCVFWDVGGKMQPLWERYYKDCHGVIFVSLSCLTVILRASTYFLFFFRCDAI